MLNCFPLWETDEMAVVCSTIILNTLEIFVLVVTENLSLGNSIFQTKLRCKRGAHYYIKKDTFKTHDKSRTNTTWIRDATRQNSPHLSCEYERANNSLTKQSGCPNAFGDKPSYMFDLLHQDAKKHI